MKPVKKIACILLTSACVLASAACQRLETVNVPKADPGPAQASQEPTPAEAEEKPAVDYYIPKAFNQGLSLLYGYVDQSGKTVIEPQFKGAEPFYACGVAIVIDKNDRTGLIDKKGNYIVEPKYNFFNYSEGLFLTYDNDAAKTVGFDEKGKKQFEYDGYLYEFHDGLAAYYGEPKKGYINTKGELVIELDYYNLMPFSNGIAKVSEVYNGPSHYIDTKGNDLTDTRSSGLRLFKDEQTNLFGYRDKNGTIVIPPQFIEAEPFLDGYAIVNASDHLFGPYYGIIDTKGNYVIEPMHCGIERRGNGLIAVGEKTDSDFMPYEYYAYGKKALFTSDMKKNTDWLYYSVHDFDEELVCVNDEDSVYFIGKDLEKNEKLPTFKGQGYFEKDEELLRGEYNGLVTIADRKGNILARMNEITILGDGIEAVTHITYPSRTISLTYPVITGLKDKTIQEKVNALIVEDMVEPYKSITFPTEEDVYSILVLYTKYSVNRQKDLLLIDQLIEDYVIGAAHGMYYRNTLYIDLAQGVKYEMKDLFNSVTVYDFLSEKVSAQMKEKMEEVGYWEDHVTITPNVGFAIGEGGIYLYFPPYELASYAAGMQEFFVSFKDLDSYINKEGGFWKSFN